VPPGAVALVLTAAVAHATWNFLAKGGSREPAFIAAFSTVAAVVWLPAAIVAAAVAHQGFGGIELGIIAVSSLLDAAYFVLLAQAYRAGDLSLVYPLARGTGPALSVAGAVLLFGERLTPLAAAGSALVIAGIVVMSWPGSLARGREAAASIAFAVATGAIIASYTLWDSRGVDRVTPLVFEYGRELLRASIFLPLALVTAGGRGSLREVWREHRLAAVGVGVLSPGAYVLVLAALTMAPVTYVAPAREVSIVFGAVLGWRLLGESEPLRRVGGACAIVAGVFALALG
jgi:drug/metabolite transporter (DMT)-like permease